MEWMALVRESDAERILAMNPNFIILRVGTPDGFLNDPRWQSLEAVTLRRVYSNIIWLDSNVLDIDTQPSVYRWLAELICPDILQPRLRRILRTNCQNSYKFHLNDFEIDILLRLDINRQSNGFFRFARES
ncbi:MAG: hypothetical protein LBP22_05540 [Deltaproteobacteria bacterium]|jgi:hypothetical protein|nr:hypothetical protein [Deltaproteobacteria bacterium]